jgi:3-phenylpropionate/trans-cinnamate dioxygenase ferredoxin subunit
VGSVEELAQIERKLIFVDGRSIVIFNIGGVMHAIDNSCPHNGASLANGKLEGHTLQCPAHGLRFDVTTGCSPGVGGLCLTTFPVATTDGRVVVVLDEPHGIGRSRDSTTQDQSEFSNMTHHESKATGAGTDSNRPATNLRHSHDKSRGSETTVPASNWAWAQRTGHFDWMDSCTPFTDVSEADLWL